MSSRKDLIALAVVLLIVAVVGRVALVKSPPPSPPALPSPSQAGSLLPEAMTPRAGWDNAPPDEVIAGPIVVPVDAADVAAGRDLFETSCAACHGRNGEGNGPAGMMLYPRPVNFRTDKLRYGADDAHLFTTVWLGARHWRTAPNTSGMGGAKGTKLTREQVLQILAFVKHDCLGKK